MKLRNFGLMLTVVASLAAGNSFAGDAEVWLVNSTGHPIREIYLSPATRSQWGGDRLLDNAAIENQKQVLLKFGARLACVQDLKVVFEDDDSEAVVANLDMCAIDKVTLRFDSAARTFVALKQ